MAPVTPLTHPQLPWQSFEQMRHIAFAVVPGVQGVRIFAWSQRNGQTMQRPCSSPQTAVVRVADWARQWGG